MENNMDMVYKNGMMVLNMKENGKMGKRMAMVYFIILMEMYIKAIGKMIKHMDMELI